jgi:hypothetical protein
MQKSGKEISEDLIQLLKEISPEKNAIIDKFNSLELFKSLIRNH